MTDITDSIIDSGKHRCKPDSKPENTQIHLELGGTDAPVRERRGWTVGVLGLPADLHIPRFMKERLFTLSRLTALKEVERYVLQVLLLHCRYDNLAEPVFPSMERIGDMIGGRSVRTVSKAIKNLEAAGYIVRQVRRKVHGRYRGVTHTYFTPLVADLVQMPYLPQAVRQKSLFDQAMAGLQKVAGVISQKIDVKQWSDAWNRQRESTANHALLQRLSLPAELLFLLDRGVRAMDLFRWSKMLRKSRSSLTLTEIVQKKRWALEKARNAGAYLRTLVKKVLNGEKIKEIGEWVEENNVVNGRLRADRNSHREYLIKQYEGQTYYDSNAGFWVKVFSQGDARIYDENPTSLSAIAKATRSLEWLHERIQSGQLKICEKHPPGTEGDDPDSILDRGMGAVRAALSELRRRVVS